MPCSWIRKLNTMKMSVLILIYRCSANPNKNTTRMFFKEITMSGFPGGTVVKNPPANAGDMGSSPGPGRSHMPRSN